MISFLSFALLVPVVYLTLKLNRAKLVVWQEIAYVLASLVVFVLSCIFFFPAVLLIVAGSIALHYKDWLGLFNVAKEAAYVFLFTRKVIIGEHVIKVSPRVKRLTIDQGYRRTIIHDQDGNTVLTLETATNKYDHLFPMEFK
jgi:hypothetical protein